MRYQTLNTDVWRILTLVSALQVFYVFFLRRPVEAATGVETPLWLSLVSPLLLLTYAWIPWWRDRLGRVYLPAFLLFTSLYILVDRYLTLSLFIPPAQQELGVLLLTLKSWVTMSVVALLVAWQYSRGTVLWVSLALCIVDGALSLPFMMPGSPLYLLTLILLFSRLVFVVSVAVGVQWLVDRQHQQRVALMGVNRKLKQYVATTERLATTQERNRLARELHDTLAHSLSGVTVQLEAVEALWEINPPDARRILDHARQTAQNGLTEARRALEALRASPLEDMGLALAVRNLAKSAAARASLRLDLDVQNHIEDLEPDVEQCIYRVTQETLTNVTRHADARSLRVALRREAEGVTLTIADDGRGFDLAAVNHARFGLQGLHERAEMVGATLQVASALQKGTTVRLVVPTAEAGI